MFKLVNVSRVANIEAGAFNESMVSLKTFQIENASDGPGSSSVGAGAFEAIQNLRRIDLGESFELPPSPTHQPKFLLV